MQLLKTVAGLRTLRSLVATESSARVLDLHALYVEDLDDVDYAAHPLFVHPLLNRSIIVKHNISAGEADWLAPGRFSATKVIFPFDRANLNLGGQLLFIEQRGLHRRPQPPPGLHRPAAGAGRAGAADIGQAADPRPLPDPRKPAPAADQGGPLLLPDQRGRQGRDAGLRLRRDRGPGQAVLWRVERQSGSAPGDCRSCCWPIRRVPSSSRCARPFGWTRTNSPRPCSPGKPSSTTAGAARRWRRCSPRP